MVGTVVFRQRVRVRPRGFRFDQRGMCWFGFSEAHDQSSRRLHNYTTTQHTSTQTTEITGLFLIMHHKAYSMKSSEGHGQIWQFKYFPRSTFHLQRDIVQLTVTVQDTVRHLSYSLVSPQLLVWYRSVMNLKHDGQVCEAFAQNMALRRVTCRSVCSLALCTDIFTSSSEESILLQNTHSNSSGCAEKDDISNLLVSYKTEFIQFFKK